MNSNSRDDFGQFAMLHRHGRLEQRTPSHAETVRDVDPLSGVYLLGCD